MKQLRANDMEVTAGTGDAGIRMSGKCPNCGDTVGVAEYQWWDAICSCGNVWYLVLSIVSDKNTADEETK